MARPARRKALPHIISTPNRCGAVTTLCSLLPGADCLAAMRTAEPAGSIAPKPKMPAETGEVIIIRLFPVQSESPGE
jgi:hypothetical protein